MKSEHRQLLEHNIKAASVALHLRGDDWKLTKKEADDIARCCAVENKLFGSNHYGR